MRPKPVIVWLRPSVTPEPTMRAALDAGLQYILLREPMAPAQAIYTAAMAALRAGLQPIVNDRLDVALALRAVCQLRGDSLPLPAARRIAPHWPLGQAVHGVEEARQAATDGADYIVYGHIFETGSKPGLPPRGTEALREVVAAVEIPVLAIGGIRADRLADVLVTGCAGAVMASAIRPERAAVDVATVCAALAGDWPTRPTRSTFMEVMASCAST